MTIKQHIPSTPLEQLHNYIVSESNSPLFYCGNALSVLSDLPDQSIDCCMTSPPYWNKREYQNGGIGLEDTYQEYMVNLLQIFDQVKRVLKVTGSFWLNIGDVYVNKTLIGLPWRLSLEMIDKKGWILRNDVVWNKIKGPDNAKDKLRNTHEFVFHFVRKSKGYYYNDSAIRSRARESYVRNGAIVSATGVTGVRYKRQIELSTALTQEEKKSALYALDEMLASLVRGEVSDFRMVIRNQQRTTHSNSEKVSGRAKELLQKGFYFLKYHPDGSKPSDVWDIIPEDTVRKNQHYASYPEDLCKMPILATCPPNGVVLDPFCGTGTTNYVAHQLRRKSIGIDISQQYINIAIERCETLL